MATEVKVPVLPESVADATIAAWYKQPGDSVSRDENLLDLETDKVVLEVPAPADGILGDVHFQVGDSVVSGQVLALISDGASLAAKPSASSSLFSAKPVVDKEPELASFGSPAPSKIEPPDMGIRPVFSATVERPTSMSSPFMPKAPAEPMPHKAPSFSAAQANSIPTPEPVKINFPPPRSTAAPISQPAQVQPSIVASAAPPKAPPPKPAPPAPVVTAPAPPVSVRPQQPAPVAPAPAVTPPQPSASTLPPGARFAAITEGVKPEQVQGSGRRGAVTKEDILNYARNSGAATASGARAEERVPMTRIRKRIAQRLMESKNAIAMLTTFNEVNLSNVAALRKQLGEDFHKAYGIKLGFMSFFVKAAANALQRFPVVNASVDNDDIIYHGYSDISIAVSTERGLVTPVLRSVESMDFAQIEQGIANYAQKARDGKLGLDDLQGGTFTVTNGGTFGSLLSTPIVNPPQSAILGMHSIKERPIAENGQVIIAPMMYLALSYDHRIIDGKDAVQFLVDMKNQLENPARMLFGL